MYVYAYCVSGTYAFIMILSRLWTRYANLIVFYLEHTG